MLILFCEKCGKRIPQNVLDARGVTQVDPEQFYYCDGCEPEAPAAEPEPVAAAPAPIVENRRSGARAMRPTSGFTQAVKSGANARIKRPTTAEVPLRDTARLQRSQSPAPVQAVDPATKRARLIIAAACGVMILAATLILCFGKSEAKKVDNADANSKIPDPPKKDPKINVPAPPVQPIATVQPAPPTVPAPPAPDKTVSDAPKELSPKEAYDLRVKQGLVKPATATTTAGNDGPLATMTDPDALRTRLLAMGGGFPHDAVRHLGELPPPQMEVETAWAFDMKKLRSDYNSKVTAGTYEGEAGCKIEGGDSSRVACYDDMSVVVNHTHIKLRVFQKGLKKMRFSSQTRFGERYNMDFDPPPEGKWGDLDITFGNAACGDVKFENQPIKHIEIHGFRTAENNGAYFILSKFDVVNGEQ